MPRWEKVGVALADKVKDDVPLLFHSVERGTHLGDLRAVFRPVVG